MDVRSLIGFVAVAEELSFRRAAERLHLGQPGLSRLVAKLERQVGVKLLDRSTTHVKLTAAGEAFLEHACSILAATEAAVRAAQRNGASPSDRLGVGLSEWTERLGSRALHALRRSSPGIDLRVESLETDSPVEELCKERFDVVFCREVPSDQRVDVLSLLDEPLVAAVPIGHPLGGSKQLGISALAGEPLVLFPRDFAPGAHDQFVDLCDRTGFQPYVAYETVQLSPMTALVAAGSGIALIPASTAPRFDPVHVRCCRIDAPALTMPLVLMRRRADASTIVHRLSEVAPDVVGPGTRSAM